MDQEPNVGLAMLLKDSWRKIVFHGFSSWFYTIVHIFRRLKEEPYHTDVTREKQGLFATGSFLCGVAGGNAMNITLSPNIDEGIEINTATGPVGHHHLF